VIGALNAGPIEVEAASERLVQQAVKVGADGTHGVVADLEAVELWVVGVALCASSEDGLREQRLAPTGDEPHAIELSWMN
jgi:hypothetical protein